MARRGYQINPHFPHPPIPIFSPSKTVTLCGGFLFERLCIMSLSVRIQDAVKRYGDFYAVNHITLSINGGEFFTLLGPSGCGKTTLLRMIAGFNEIDGGKIFFGDRCINDIPPHRRNTGMVFQNYAIFPHLSVADNVAYGLRARDAGAAEQKERTAEALALMQIENLADRMPSQLSGGQQQRVALARAIVIRPDVLLMDEPLSNLDAKLRLMMRTNIRRIQKELGITTIYVTHDQEEALAISDRIAVMQAGTVMQLGTPREIYTHPANTFVADFIGTSNFLTGKAEAESFDVLGTLSFSGGLSSGYQGALKISVRPEDVGLVSPESSALRGTVRRVTYLGTNDEYEIALADDLSLISKIYRTRGGQAYDIGDTVGITLEPAALTLYTEDGKEALS